MRDAAKVVALSLWEELAGGEGMSRTASAPRPLAPEVTHEALRKNHNGEKLGGMG